MVRWIIGIIAAAGAISFAAWLGGWVAGIGATLVVVAVTALVAGGALVAPFRIWLWVALALGVVLVATGWAWARYVSPYLPSPAEPSGKAAPAAAAPRPNTASAATPSSPAVPWPERPPVCEEFLLEAGKSRLTVPAGPGTIHRIEARKPLSVIAALPSGMRAEVPLPAGDSGWIGEAPLGLLRIVSAEDQRVRICRIQ